MTVYAVEAQAKSMRAFYPRVGVDVNATDETAAIEAAERKLAREYRGFTITVTSVRVSTS